MKITKSQIKQMIEEEIKQASLSEMFGFGKSDMADEADVLDKEIALKDIDDIAQHVAEACPESAACIQNRLQSLRTYVEEN